VALTNHGPGGLAGAPTAAAVGRVPQEGEDELSVYYRTVSAGYFSTMGSRMSAGREFTDDDLAGGEGPLIVNETLAARMGGAKAAVGGTLGVRKAASSRADFGEPLLGTVVGVVADLDRSETGGEPVPIVYVPFTHTPWGQVRILARTSGSTPATMRAVEDAVRSIEPGIPLTGPFVSVWRLTDIRASQRSEERLNAGLVGAFAAVALLLACIGMYGVTSFIVTLRRREMGVRMALGATPRSVAAGIVRHAALVGSLGLLGGVATGAALSSLIAGLLFGVGPLDPGRYVVVAVSLLALVALAAYVPARRASELDPALVLRSE
jgi:putative ABC transport system permease protein